MLLTRKDFRGIFNTEGRTETGGVTHTFDGLYPEGWGEEGKHSAQ